MCLFVGISNQVSAPGRAARPGDFAAQVFLARQFSAQPGLGEFQPRFSELGDFQPFLKNPGMAGIPEPDTPARARPGARNFQNLSSEPGPDPEICYRASPARRRSLGWPNSENE